MCDLCNLRIPPLRNLRSGAALSNLRSGAALKPELPRLADQVHTETLV
jgi:hypothetical protein